MSIQFADLSLIQEDYILQLLDDILASVEQADTQILIASDTYEKALGISSGYTYDILECIQDNWDGFKLSSHYNKEALLLLKFFISDDLKAASKIKEGIELKYFTDMVHHIFNEINSLVLDD